MMDSPGLITGGEKGAVTLQDRSPSTPEDGMDGIGSSYHEN